MKQVYSIYCDCAKDCRTNIDKCLTCEFVTIIKIENCSKNNKSLEDF